MIRWRAYLGGGMPQVTIEADDFKHLISSRYFDYYKYHKKYELFEKNSSVYYRTPSGSEFYIGKFKQI